MLKRRLSPVLIAASCVSFLIPFSALAQTVIMSETFESPIVMAPPTSDSTPMEWASRWATR